MYLIRDIKNNPLIFVLCSANFKHHSIFQTTYLTIYRFGALGSIGYKSVEERGFPSGNGRKKLFYTESAVAGALTCRGSVVQVHLSSPSPVPRHADAYRGFFFFKALNLAF